MGQLNFKDFLACFLQIKLKAATKKNTVEKNSWAEELENKYFRKVIENTFSEITAKFPKKIHAVTSAGLLLKILIAIIAIITLLLALFLYQSIIAIIFFETYYFDYSVFITLSPLLQLWRKNNQYN